VNLYCLLVYIEHKWDESPEDTYRIMAANKSKEIINSTSQKKKHRAKKTITRNEKTE